MMKNFLRDARELLKVGEVLLFLYLVPFVALAFFSFHSFQVLTYTYHFVVAIMVFQAALSYWFTTSALPHKQFTALPATQNRPVPKTTFIVVAYLPNEVSVVEQTLMNILENVERPAAGIELIFVYNTPHFEPLELRLRELAYRFPELILANAYQSRSKSENLNYALEIASGEMVVILDADHIVSAHCLGHAWRWLDGGYDVVQGRCRIRNGSASPVAMLVQVEFDIIYGIQHSAKSFIFDTSLFGGSNGYWKAQSIKKIRFREDVLTEDIDGTLQGIRAGLRFVHDRTIISEELAPTTLRGLWYQRKRWSQGWFQCSLRHQWAVWTTPHLNCAQKFMWTTLLSWRVGYDILSGFLFPVIFAYWFNLDRIYMPVTPYISFALIFTLFSGPYQTIAAYKNTVRPRPSAFVYLYYAFFVWPYTVFKNLIHMVAIRDELMGERKWIVTKK